MAAVNGAINGTSSTKQLAIRLRTRTRHEIPEAKFFVPAEWKRYQLSELINKVLEYEKPVPFDFIVDGELLRSSLSAYIASKGLSEESALEIEYVESILPPEYVSAFEHDDWVSDVDLGRSGVFLSACYNGAVSLFSAAGRQEASISAHTQPALSSCWVGEEELIASGGMDRVIRVHRLSAPLDSPDESQRSAALAYSLPLHSQPVASVRSSKLPAAKPRLLSSGWDGLVALWHLDEALQGGEEVDGEIGRSKKRRRRIDDKGDAPRLAPVHVLRGHAGQVGRAVFDRADATKAYSCGWDHSVRTWDLETGGQTSAKSAADKVLLDVDQMASANLLVTASTDRTVCFWDTRQDSSTIAVTLQGHSAPVSTVRAHPTSAVLALSAGYDGMLRIWDARSPKQALFAVRRRDAKGPLQNKILCADWDATGALMAAGGEDGRVELHRASTRVAE